MLAPKPAGTGTPYDPVAATQAIMWACALATARVAAASTFRSLELWSQLLRAGRPAQGCAPMPATAASTDAPADPGPSSTPFPPVSYRSSSGHAAAQIVVSD
jgi:hypothetical protein